MLCLSRRTNEKVVITTNDGTRIVINVEKIENRKVYLGFEAPQDVKINRIEIQYRIDEGISNVHERNVDSSGTIEAVDGLIPSPKHD